MSKKFYNLKALIFGDESVGKTSLQNSISDRPSENFILIDDPQTNLELVYLTQTNPPQDTQIQDVLFFLAVYDITSYLSFESIQKIFCQTFNSLIQKTFQFTFLIGNKRDLEDQRAVLTSDGDSLAKQYQMTFFEVSAKTGKSIDMLKKMIRIKSTQMMKKFNIQPTDNSLEAQYIKEEEQNSESYTSSSYDINQGITPSNRSSVSDNDDQKKQEIDQQSVVQTVSIFDKNSQKSKSSRNSFCTPPKFPVRAELSPEFQSDRPPPLPIRDYDVENPLESSSVQTPVSQKQQAKQNILSPDNTRPLPDPPQESASQKKQSQEEEAKKIEQTKNDKRPSLIASIASNPMHKVNLGARFNQVITKATFTLKVPTQIKQERKNSFKRQETQPEQYTININTSKEDDNENNINSKISNKTQNFDRIRKKAKTISAVNYIRKLESAQVIKLSEIVQSRLQEEAQQKQELESLITPRQRAEEEQKLSELKIKIKNIFDEFVNENEEEKRIRQDIQKLDQIVQIRSQREIIKNISIQKQQEEYESIQQYDSYQISRSYTDRSDSPFYSKCDPRIYSKKQKSLMKLAIEYQKKVYYVDVYFEDTPIILVERFFQEMNISIENKQVYKSLSQVFDNAIKNFDLQLQSQYKIMQTKKLQPQLFLDGFFRMKVDEASYLINQMKQSNKYYQKQVIYQSNKNEIQKGSNHLKKVSSRNYLNFRQQN